MGHCILGDADQSGLTTDLFCVSFLNMPFFNFKRKTNDWYGWNKKKHVQVDR